MPTIEELAIMIAVLMDKYPELAPKVKETLGEYRCRELFGLN